MKRITKLFFICFIVMIAQLGVNGIAVAQICNMIGNNGSDQITDKTCAPVTLTMPVNFAFLAPVDHSKVQIRFEWGHDNQITTYPAIYNSALNRYEVRGVHVYPETLQGNCSYTAEAYVIYDGIACTGTRQRQTFAFWGKDDENSGKLIADPVIYRVCHGTAWEVNFRDNSLFNCRIDIEPDRPNQLTRWVQFIYGPNVAGNKIPNVSVTVPAPGVAGGPAPGVYQLTDASGNVIPYPANPSGFFEGPVIEIPALALGPNQTSYQLSAPAGGDVGNFFEIRLNNWNICNPYKDAMGVVTTNLPKFTTSRVVIVTKPNANIRITKNKAVLTEPEVTKFCPGDRIHLRATTTFPAGAAARHLISIYDGPDETYQRIFYRTTNNRNDTSNFKMPNDIDPGYKTIVIESIDRNSNNNNGTLGCTDKEIKQIEVVPAPIAKIITSEGTKTIDFCKNDEDDEFYVTFSDDPAYTNQATTVFKWVFKDINKNTETVYGPSFGSALPTFVDVPFKDPGEYQIIYTTEDLNTRCGTTDIAYVRVYSRPIADFDIKGQQVLCEKKNVIFEDLSKDFFDISKLENDKIIKRRWYFDYVNDPLTFVEFNDGDEVSNSYTTAGTYTVRLEIETGNSGCSANVSKDFVIEVNPSPEAVFTAPAAACAGNFTFVNNSFNNQPATITGPVSYSWLIYEVDEDGVEEFIEERIDNSTNGQFEYIFTNSETFDKIYAVRLKAKAANLCEFVSAPQQVTVNPGLIARFHSNYDSFNKNCGDIEAGVYFEVDNDTQGLDVDKYIWEIINPEGDKKTIQVEENIVLIDHNHFGNVFENTSNSVRQYTVILRVVLNSSSICISPFQQPVRTNPVPNSNFNIELFSENCDDVFLRFNAGSKGLKAYIWDISPAPDPSYNPIRNDDFRLLFKRPEAHESDLVVTAKLQTENSTLCRSTETTHTFTILKKSHIDVTLDVTSANNGCHEFTGSFSNSTSVYPPDTKFKFFVAKDGGTAVIKSITSGDIFTSFTYKFESAGAYEVQLQATAPDSCKFLSPPVNIVVHPAVKAKFTPDFQEGCSPLTVNFVDESTNLTDLFKIRWTIINKQTGIKEREELLDPRQKFEETFVNTSLLVEEYKIIQEAISIRGCTDTISTIIKVFPEAYNDFEIISMPICFPYEVTFRNKNLNNNPAGTNYIWLWGDGTFSETNDEFVTHVYSNTTYTTTKKLGVRLRAITSFGCEPQVDPIEIEVNPRVKAEIIADKTSGCAPLDVSFSNFSKGHNTSKSKWYKRSVGTANFEEISSASYAMMHTFENASGMDEQYEIRYVAESTAGCKDTTEVTITVFADLKATFTASPYYQVLPERTVYLEREDQTVHDSFDYFWEFGDGTSSTEANPGSHIYPSYGTYEITLSVSGNNCTARHKETIIIGAITPIVDFEFDPPKGCLPLKVNFTDKSLWTDVSTYHWDFGDGKGTSDAQNPSYTYSTPGIYTVSLTASNELGNPIQEKKDFIIEVFDNPRAIFQIRPTTVYLPGNPIYTANTSVNAISYLWDFGDGNTSTDFEPTHVYTEMGVYSISLTVTNEQGCTNTLVLRNAVKVDDGAELRIPNAFTPNPIGPGSSGGTGGVNDVFMPLTEGVTEFNMMIFNRWGELLYESKNINDGWDGYYKGKICKQDVYVYKIQVKFKDGESATRIGDVTLIR